MNQKEKNVLSSDCFEVIFLYESDGILLEKAHPVTDEEGMKEKGYTFTIKNTCNTLAYYQVNLEEIKLPEETKRIDDEYIKVSLNDSDGKELDQYSEVEPTIEEVETDISHKLTSGSLEPDQEKTYTLKLWMNYDTPAIESVMNATFESKISIISSYMEQEKLENTIEVTSTSKNTEYSKEKETIAIKATSKNYDIIEYSYDNKKFNSLTPNKNVTIEKEETKEGTYQVYFKDEVGNIEEKSYETTKLDQTSPTIEVEEESGEKGAVLTIHLSDAKSGLSEYKIEDKGLATVSEEENWIPLEGNTIDVSYESMENKTIIIKAKDQLGNSQEKEYEITKADITGPSIRVENPHDDEWTSEDVILTITAEDDISGVEKIYYRKQTEPESEWIELSNPTLEGKTGIGTLTIQETTNETYEFKAKDKLGNESNIERTIVKVDKSAGSASFGIESETAGSNGWKKALTVKVTVADNESAVSSAKYCMATGETCIPNQDANLSNGTFNVLFGNNANAQKVCVTVTNGAGKESEVLCDNNTYQVDGEGPTIKSPSAATEWGQTNSLGAKVEDSISGIEAYAFDKSNTTTKDTIWTTNTNYPKTEQIYSGSADSNGDWYVHVRDQAGNISSTKITVSKVDTSAATASYAIGSQTEGSNGWKQALEIQVTATDNESGVSSAKYCVTTSSTCDPTSEASLSTGTTSKTFNVTFSNNASTQKVCVKITNGVGKESEILCDPTTYKVDGAKPTITGVNVSVSGTTITASIEGASDTGGSNISQYVFQLNTNSEQTSTINNWNFTGLVGGTSYKVKGYIVDGAGNKSNSITSSSVFVPIELTTYLKNTVPKVTSGNGLYSVTPTLSGWTTTEYRYAGASPSNYVIFNGETKTWRIIGLVNVKTTSGKIEQRIKIIRNSIGSFNWDNSENNVNEGYGINEWSQANIMKLLNPGYETNKGTICTYDDWSYEMICDGTTDLVNNSLYWNGGNGTCYDYENNGTTTCNFSNIGLSKSESYISNDIVWNIGTNGSNDYTSSSKGLAKHFYEYERSSSNGKICDSGNFYCNDKVQRTTEWKSANGKKALVGLMYPSDYGYAVGGGASNRTSCLDTAMYSWRNSEDCSKNDWLFDKNTDQLTMSPYANSITATGVFYVGFYGGYVNNGEVSTKGAVRPVVYLNSSVKITGGTGTSANPYTLSGN